MAKTISDETIKLSIIINGDDAQKEMFDLEKATRRLNEENRALNLEKKKLEKQNRQDSAEYKALTKSIRENNAELKSNKSRMAELRAEIGLLGLTTKQLGAEANRLKLILANLIPGSADHKRYTADLKAVTDRMDEVRGKGQAAKWSIGGLADSFNRYSAIGVSIIAVLTGVVLSIHKIITANGALARAQTNVQKTTGMTKREVDELTKSFGLLKTATTRIDLLKIAEIGGRLGIPKAEIQDFVKVMDKSAVALGDSFEGGPEVVAEKLGRIKGLYEELKNVGVEEAFEGVGSALNDLGAAGTASEQNVAEFVQRVGTLPGKLKPSIATALGLGAAFEESGLKAELAGNNYGKVISIAARDTAAFAKVMGRPVKELEGLLNSDPTEFFLQFSKSLKGLDPTDLAKVLDYLKLNDNEVKMVLGAASDNVDLFREKIALAGKSMEAATSLTNEYNLKNADLQAVLDRVKKKMMGWFTSDSLVAFLEAGVNWFAKFIGAVDDEEGKISAFKNTVVFTAKMLAVFGAALLTNVAWMKLLTVWTNRNTEATLLYNIGLKARTLAEAASVIGTRAMVLVQNMLALNVKGTVQAFKALTLALKTTPWGFALTLISTAVAAYIAFSDNVKKATAEQTAFNNIQRSVAASLKDEEERIRDLIAIAKDEKLAKETRLKAIKDLNEISPEYLGNLTLEKIGTEEATKAINAYIMALDKKLEAEQIDNEIKASRARVEEIYKKDTDEYKNWYDGMFDADTEKARNAAATKRINAAVQEEDDLRKRLLERRKQLYIELQGIMPGSTTSSKITVPDAAAEKKATAAAEKLAELKKKWAEEERKQNIENAKKLAEEIASLEQRIKDEELGQLQEGFEKERRLEEENHRRKLADLKKQLVDEAVITNLDAKIEDPATKVMDKAYLLHYKDLLLQKNKQANKLIELEEQRFFRKMDSIDLNEDTNRIQKIQETFDREAVLRQTEHNNAMAALGSNELAKQRLQEKFDLGELEHQREFLGTLIGEKAMLLADLQQMDFSLLTPEQQLAMQDEIDQLKLKISELLLAKSGLQGKGGTDEIGQAFKTAFGGADVLGFTADQWGAAFSSLDTLSEKLQAAVMVVGALQNMWGTYNAYVAENESAQLRKFENNSNAKKKKLKWQLDNGYINQSQYKKQLEELDLDLENKKAALERKQAKRQKQMAMFNIIANTAQAIMGIWAQFPKVDFGATAALMSGVVGALGLVQLATVAKTPLPAQGYEDGLYPDEVMRQQDGKRFKATYRGRTRSGMVNRPEYFLAGENGPEMVIDAAAYRQMPAETKALLVNYLRGVKGVPGYQDGKYNADVTGGQRYEVRAASGSNATTILLQQAIAVMGANTAVLEKIQKEGISAWVDKDYRNMKDLQERFDKLNASREKAKQ